MLKGPSDRIYLPPTLGERPGSGINRARALNKAATFLGVLGVVALIGGAVSGVVRGYNNKPRTEGQGVTLSDPELDTDLRCTRDSFHDAAEGQLLANKWFRENCPDEIKGKIAEAMQSEDPLRALTGIRDEILARSGEYPAGAEEWRKEYEGASNGFTARITRQ